MRGKKIWQRCRHGQHSRLAACTPQQRGPNGFTRLREDKVEALSFHRGVVCIVSEPPSMIRMDMCMRGILACRLLLVYQTTSVLFGSDV